MAMMMIASVSEMKNTLSALLDKVKAGETVLIVDRGRPVARLEPATAGEEPDDLRLARLERNGIIRRGRGPSKARATYKAPRLKSGVSIVETLLEERRSGR